MNQRVYTYTQIHMSCHQSVRILRCITFGRRIRRHPPSTGMYPKVMQPFDRYTLNITYTHKQSVLTQAKYAFQIGMTFHKEFLGVYCIHLYIYIVYMISFLFIQIYLHIVKMIVLHNHSCRVFLFLFVTYVVFSMFSTSVKFGRY